MDPSVVIRRFATLPPVVRVGSAIAVAFLIGLIVIVASLARETRAQLFAVPLHPEQLAEVQERLAEWNVPFTAGADNVAVDAKRRNDLLLRLALAGVPHAHIDTSAEMLAKVSALTPQSIIDAQARSGLSSDLELALRGIDGVQDATVIVAPAKAAVFADEQSRDASASVRLRLRPGARLAPDAVAGIRAFVTSGVPGLDERSVTILDDRGFALGGATSGRTDPTDLQSSLQSALDSAYGAGTSIVRVHVDYDARTQQIKEVRRAPLGVPLSSERSDEAYAGAGKHYTKSTRTEERGGDLREVSTAVAGGGIARVSVAVAVDESRGADLYKIRALVSAAAGLDARRGDTIAVQAVQFHSQRTGRPDVWFGVYGALLSALPPALPGCIALVALKTVRRPAARLINTLLTGMSIAQTRKAVTGFAPSQVRSALHNEPPHTAAAIISALPAATAAAVLDLYPAHERAAIVRRMARAHSPLVPDYETVIANA